MRLSPRFFALVVTFGLGLAACGTSPPGDTGSHSDAGMGDGAADGGEGGLPPYACSATLDGTAATLFYDAARCLFEGSDPPQKGVAAGVIDRERVAMVRGRVIDGGGASLGDVRISVLQHPEYGTTSSRADGSFAMAVNGGGTVTLRYEKNEFLLAQRHMRTEWRLFTVFPDVALLHVTGEVGQVELGKASTVVRGPKSEDSSGARQPWVLFSPTTAAQMVLPDGTKQPLSALHLRMTEYSVGQRGVAAMPGDLPASSAYTYAAEFTVDEAMAAGATRVEFDPPVTAYVDNFLRFPAGTVVPAGVYDRERDVWQAGDSGQVVQITSIEDGVAKVDTDGDGVADNATKLSKLGIDDDELRALGQSYLAGQSAWRVKLAHFSAWDLNWPFSPPKDATAPWSAVFGFDTYDCETKVSGSIIGCETQTLGEAVGIAGTPYALHYQSERTAGRLDVNEITIQLSGDTIPDSVKRIELEVEVLGQITKKSYPPSANLRDVYRWDGKDAWGRRWQGGQTATVRVGYVYDGAYQKTTRFGYSGNGIPITGDQARSEVTLWRIHRTHVGGLLVEPLGLGGFTLNAQHTYDPRGGMLYLGNGEKRSAERIGNVISTVAGNGTNGSMGDDGPATAASIGKPHGVVVGPDGTVFYSGETENRIRKIAPSGIITTYAGTGVAGFAGDGDLAINAQLEAPMGLALDKDGTLYVADSANARVRAISPAGIITTVAGGGDPATAGKGEGGPATKAVLATPHAVALGGDGTLYIGDLDAHRIQAVGPDGMIHLFAGGGTLSGNDADGHNALEINVGDPLGLAVGADQELYFADWAGNRVRRIDASGVVSTVVGGGTGTAEGILARDSAISAPHTVDRSQDGSLYITEEGKFRVRRVRPDGVIETVAGGGAPTDSLGDNGPPLNAKLALPRVVYVHRDGSLWIADYNSSRIRRVQAPLPGFTTTEFAIASSEGAELYVFDDHGRHLRTIDTLTSLPLLTFGYDASGHLADVSDRDGNKTTVTRDGSGHPTAIVGPFGQATKLAVGNDGYLGSVTNPNGEITSFAYQTGGLLSSKTDPRGPMDVHRFAYDDAGRLLKDTDPSGFAQTLTRTETSAGHAVALRSMLGRTRTLQIETSGASDQKATSTFPDGTVTSTVRSPSGHQQTSPTRTTQVKYAADPRFGMQSPVSATTDVQEVGGPKATITGARAVVLADPTNPLSVKTFTETTAINGRAFVSSWDAASRTWTSTSAEKRKTTSTFDALNHVVTSKVGDLAQLAYAYDARGRLTSVTEDARRTSFEYGADGWLESITDALGRVSQVAHDGVGRITAVTLPDGSLLGSSYDRNGNVTSITPPSKPAHGMTYGLGDLLGKYTPPAVPGSGTTSTGYSYDLDQMLSELLRPDQLKVNYAYDSAGRPSVVTLPTGTVSFSYDDAGRLSTVGGPYDQTVTFGYAGDLVTEETHSGVVAGAVHFTYDTQLQVASEALNDGAPIAFAYDNDGLLKMVGGLTVARSPATGFITGTRIGSVTDAYTHSGYGEAATYVTKYGATVLLQEAYTRDALGRITEQKETVQNVAHTYGYAYDVRGRLTDVTADGAKIAHHAYDANGNRTEITTPTGTLNATYDAQDRLLTQGTATYTYGANGELTSKTDGADTTSYTYDARGSVTKIVTSRGKTIEYVYDGLGRLIAKKVDGQLAQGFLYSGALHPIAELDAAGNVLSRFVYGAHGHVPDLVIQGATTYRVFSDHLGSPRVVVDVATGKVAQQIAYDAWGNVISDSAPGFQPFGFAGGLYDRDTGFVRYGARDYDASVGRWTDKDPSGFAGGTNHYLYANGDPVNYIDVDGRNPILVAIAIGAVEGALSGALIDIALQAATKGCIEWGQVGDAALSGAVMGGAVSGIGAWLMPPSVLPGRLARVIPGEGPFPTLGPPSKVDVFVTAADDIAGMNPAQIAERLTIQKSSSFTVIEFRTPAEGLASPVFRSDPGFIGRGITRGGAREFVLPNGPIPRGATTRVVR